MNAGDRRAWGRARLLYPGARPYQRAYVNGAAAARRGEGERSCPYKLEARTTWRAGYRKAWLAGWQSARTA